MATIKPKQHMSGIGDVIFIHTRNSFELIVDGKRFNEIKSFKIEGGVDCITTVETTVLTGCGDD